MINAIIVDDEINNSNYLKGLLESNLPEVKLIGVASNINDATKLITSLKPDLVFLDVELQTSTGFDLLNKLSEINFSVIFTTAHQHYALKAIKFAAIDFLLKPVDTEELIQAVQKVIKLQSQNSLKDNMSVLLEGIRLQNRLTKIAISTLSSILVIEIKDIVYCQADGPYTHFFLKDSKITSSKHLKEYEMLLEEYGFYRIHKSFLVNLAEIKKYSRSDGGFVIMSNGDKVDVSEKKKEELITKLSSHVMFT